MKTKKLCWNIAAILIAPAIVGTIMFNHNENTSRLKSTGVEVTIADAGINKNWGIIMLEGVTKNVERGDTAYIKTRGSSAGIMKVESVEGDKILVDASKVDMALLRVNDVVVIQTNRSKSEQATPRKPFSN